MTFAHNDRIIKNGSDKGYSIRVGKTLPVNSANLAYVSTKPMSPKQNLQINDLSMNIKENGLPTAYEKERIMYPADDFLLRELAGESKLPSKRITLTDEFSVPSSTQEEPVPLYYRAVAKGMFDAKGALVSPYLGGYQSSPPEEIVDYAQVDPEEIENLLYLGTKIKITNLDGTPIKSSYKYKIHLVRLEGKGIPQNAYTIYVYTNFKGNEKETFMLRYERYNPDGTHTSDYTEILNAYPFFNQVEKYYLDEIARNPKLNNEWRPELQEKDYAIVETEDNAYQVYAPSQVLIANNVTRPAHQFKYRVKGNLKSRFSNANPGVINVGVAYLNNSVMGVENLTSILKKIYEDELRPQYLEFENPFPPQKSYTKEMPKYWEIDLTMPAEKWCEYDLIIITGYGFHDMSRYNDAIRNYLKNGGRLWIDNAGETGKVLTFTSSTGIQTFLTTVGFNNSVNATGFKAVGNNADASELLNRLYALGGTSGEFKVGYDRNGVRVNPLITFGSGESANNWDPIVRYSTNQMSVMISKQLPGTIYEKGRIIVSNCGIFRSILHDDDLNMRFAINILLSLAEKKWIMGPWEQEYVFHRDNLFKEEYKGEGGVTVYVDERSDTDSSQIVAKKILKKTTRDALLPHLPSYFFSGKGTYEVEVQSNTEIAISNASIEIGTYDSTSKEAVTQWTTSVQDAIPGWSTKHMAGVTPTFKHISSNSQRGSKAIQIDVPSGGVGSHAFWSNKTPQLVSGSYRASVWMKAQNVSGQSTQGATIGIYSLSGSLIAKGTPIIGTLEWVQVNVDFFLDTAQEVEVRVGFVDGNGIGTVMADLLTVNSVGSVYMTPANDGSKPLYAYAVKPRGEVFDLRAQGFDTADITTFDPPIVVTYTIRSYVYEWDNYAGRYMRLYGNSVTKKRTIRRSDGIVNLGSLTTMLPALNGGSDWADVNNIYYEIMLGDGGGVSPESQFVNLEIYDTRTGKYFYNKDGELVIKYMDLFYGGEGEKKHILLQARTNYYTVRATKRRFGVMVEPENKIELAYPSTIDNRESWFLRIRNGSFVKKELNYNDIKDLIAYDNRYYEFQQRLFGTHYYSLPEFNRQVFKPSIGYKRVVGEIAEYVNDTTIKVQDAPLYVRQGKVRKELLAKADTEGYVFKAVNSDWSKEFQPMVYLDEDMNGNEVLVTEGFDIDYKNGLVIFEAPVNGQVKADYEYNNLEVWKRTYNNVRIRNEEMISSDRRTFLSKHPNWLQFPTPIVKITPYDGGEEKVAPVTMYTIDYSTGTVTFKEDVHDIVTVDYTHSTDERLAVRDYDILSGYIYLENEIDFKNEIYVNYYYEENFLEYRGYWDESIGQFISLDLNPSEGHYCTMPVIRKDQGTGKKFTSWEAVPTAKLMNKEVYVYILPYKNSFGQYNEHTVRHCYSLGDWQSIQKTNPAAMLLGVIHLREHTNVRETVVMDARSRGGGLKESIKEADIKRISPSSLNYWDMSTWDGTAYYKNGVVIIELPKRILDIYGGQFNEKQVNDIVRKYIAYGIYYIIEYV